MLSFAEELLVLLIDEDRGDLINIPDRTLGYALAGATLLDLALAHRTDSDAESLILVDATPTGDDLLDPTLADIAQEMGNHATAPPPDFWIARIADRADELRARALQRLVKQDIVETDEGGLLFLSRLVFRTRRYRGRVDDEVHWEIRLRIMDILLSGDIPDRRDIVIISLADACGLFPRILEPEEYAQVKDRIELIARLELVGRSITDAIRNMTLAESMAARRAIRERGGGWPRASGRWPIIGHAHKLTGDLRAFFTEQYLKHGPVFEVNAPGNSFVVLAGREANLFMIREGKSHLRTREFWLEFKDSLGAATVLPGMDGGDHRLLRRTKRNGYSRECILGQMSAAVAVVERELAELPLDRPVSVVPVMQRVMTEQIAQLSAGASSRERIEDIITFSNAMHTVCLARRYPRFMLQMPRVRRARRRLELHIERVLHEHELKSGGDANRDLVDALLELHRSTPDFLADTDMFIAAMGPFMVGLDTVASITPFALYSLLKHPDLLARARDEADALFAAGELTAAGIQMMTVTRGVILETLRMYPIVAALPRTVANSFEFGGYRIPDGTSLLMATTVTHYLPELFPDPERFDIDRYSPERRENVQPGAFVPFGLGHHGCLGQGFAEVQMILTIATLLHRMDIALEPTGYRLKIQQTPLPRPANNFKIRLRRRQ